MALAVILTAIALLVLARFMAYLEEHRGWRWWATYPIGVALAVVVYVVFVVVIAWLRR